jgi:hypothetical protein
MLNSKLSNLAVNTAINAKTALLDGGFIDYYDGVQPATVDTPVDTQVKLARLGFGTPAFAAGVAGVAIANPITSEDSALATGVASWYRCITASEEPIHDGSIGTTAANNTNIRLVNVNIQEFAEVTLDAFTLTDRKSS